MIEALYAWCADAAQSGALPPLFAQRFMVRALLAGLILGPILGALGPLVLARRLAFYSAALGHAALAGLALGVLLGEPPTTAFVGPLGTCLIAALGVGYLRRNSQLAADSLVGVLLSFSLGLGVCLLTLATRRFDVHAIESAMFGSVLGLTETDLLRLFVTAVFAGPCLALGYNSLLRAGLDPDEARAQGVPVGFLEYAFLVLLTTVLVASLKLAGALLVEGLVLVPAASARNLTERMSRYVILSMLFATLGFEGGLAVSYYLPVPTGAAVTLVLAALFAMSWFAGRALNRA